MYCVFVWTMCWWVLFTISVVLSTNLLILFTNHLLFYISSYKTSEDPHEFITKLQEFLLDELCNSEDNPGYTREGKKYDNDLYVSIKAFWDQFEGEITYETACTTCQNTTEIRALTTNLLLKFPDDDDNNLDKDCRVESLIKYLLQEECIEGYECSHCPQHTSATRKATITKFPSFLCILLCRKTEHDKNGYISSAVDFPTLGLKINRDTAYDLSATVYYKPTKGGKGHYTAISKSQALQSQHWYMYDDDKVSPCQFINKKNRVTKHAVISHPSCLNGRESIKILSQQSQPSFPNHLNGCTTS